MKITARTATILSSILAIILAVSGCRTRPYAEWQPSDESPDMMGIPIPPKPETPDLGEKPDMTPPSTICNELVPIKTVELGTGVSNVAIAATEHSQNGESVMVVQSDWDMRCLTSTVFRPNGDPLSGAQCLPRMAFINEIIGSSDGGYIVAGSDLGSGSYTKLDTFGKVTTEPNNVYLATTVSSNSIGDYGIQIASSTTTDPSGEYRASYTIFDIASDKPEVFSAFAVANQYGNIVGGVTNVGKKLAFSQSYFNSKKGQMEIALYLEGDKNGEFNSTVIRTMQWEYCQPEHCNNPMSANGVFSTEKHIIVWWNMTGARGQATESHLTYLTTEGVFIRDFYTTALTESVALLPSGKWATLTRPPGDTELYMELISPFIPETGEGGTSLVRQIVADYEGGSSAITATSNGVAIAWSTVNDNKTRTAFFGCK